MAKEGVHIAISFYYLGEKILVRGNENMSSGLGGRNVKTPGRRLYQKIAISNSFCNIKTLCVIHAAFIHLFKGSLNKYDISSLAFSRSQTVVKLFIHSLIHSLYHLTLYPGEGKSNAQDAELIYHFTSEGPCVKRRIGIT